MAKLTLVAMELLNTLIKGGMEAENTAKGEKKYGYEQ